MESALPPLVPGTLYLVATPIGNLEDITLRALRVLRECDLIAAEDTRRTGQLLKHFGISKPLISYFQFNEAKRSEQIISRLRAGEKIGPLTIVAVPGKSPGEIALHWPQRKLLIVGDAVIGNPAGRCGLLREKVMDDPAHLRRSVRDLLDLDFDVLLFGDGTPILQNAKARLTELVATFPN